MHSEILPHYNDLTEEQRAIALAARDFSYQQVLPLANKLDPSRGLIPQSMIKDLADLGYFGITIPEKFGGLGLGVLEYCIVCEELARSWMSVASLLARGNSLLVGHALSLKQKESMLPAVARGELLCALAMSESDAGSDLAAIACKATKLTNGEWSITGNKYWCTFADGADVIFVVARTQPVDPKRRYLGLSTFMLEKPRGELPKNCKGSAIPKIGYFGWNTFELRFDDARVPASALVGEEGSAFKSIAASLEEARLQTASRSIGLARGGLEDALEYASQRRQFNQPISQFQHIRFKLADMAAKVEANRALTQQTAKLLDSGGSSPMQCSMAKYLAAEMAEEVTSQALQIHGGAGYTTHFAVERYWRDARLTKIFEGSSEIQMRIISDQLLGK